MGWAARWARPACHVPDTACRQLSGHAQATILRPLVQDGGIFIKKIATGILGCCNFFYIKPPIVINQPLGAFCKKITNININCKNSRWRVCYNFFLQNKFQNKFLLPPINTPHSSKFIFPYNTQTLFNFHLSLIFPSIKFIHKTLSIKV